MSLMPELKLSEAAFEHLSEIMNGETDGVDDACLYCAEIIKEIGEVAAQEALDSEFLMELPPES